MTTLDHEFDFVRFLQTRYPGTTYTTQRLTGGLVNETVRATKSSSDDTIIPASLILKYAPPFVAGRGSEFPFDQGRQFVEAVALQLVADPSSPLQTAGLLNDVTVARLLFHDADAHVLSISDLGVLESLTTCLNGSSPTKLDVDSAMHIGARLGRFFAGLHCPQTFELARNHPARITLDSQKGPRAVVKAVVVDRIGELLRQCEYSETVSCRLQDLVSKSWNACEVDSPAALVHGDAWPGSILINRQREDSPEKVALIDWEFAHFNSSGLTTDIAIFVAHTKLHSIAAAQVNDTSLQQVCDSLLTAFLTSYRARSLELGTAWPDTFYSVDTTKEEAVSTSFQRLIITIGRELIYNALEMPWKCSCCIEKIGDRFRCGLRLQMVKEGMRYLESAGDRETCLDCWIGFI